MAPSIRCKLVKFANRALLDLLDKLRRIRLVNMVEAHVETSRNRRLQRKGQRIVRGICPLTCHFLDGVEQLIELVGVHVVAVILGSFELSFTADSRCFDMFVDFLLLLIIVSLAHISDL
jgi:hypothetical protein